MRKLIVAVVTVAIFGCSQTAFAEPCKRSATTMPMSGTDMDIVRCQISVDAQKLGELTSNLNAVLAEREIIKSDLTAAQEAKETAEKNWQQTFTAWCGARPACGLTPTKP